MENTTPKIEPDAFWLSQMAVLESCPDAVMIKNSTGNWGIGIGLKDIDGFCAALKQVAGEVDGNG